jgi:hypothetical protein
MSVFARKQVQASHFKLLAARTVHFSPTLIRTAPASGVQSCRQISTASSMHKESRPTWALALCPRAFLSAKAIHGRSASARKPHKWCVASCGQCVVNAGLPTRGFLYLMTHTRVFRPVQVLESYQTSTTAAPSILSAGSGSTSSGDTLSTSGWLGMRRRRHTAQDVKHHVCCTLYPSRNSNNAMASFGRKVASYV